MALRLNNNIINPFSTVPIIEQERDYIAQTNKKGNYNSEITKNNTSPFGNTLIPIGMKTILFTEQDIAERSSQLSLNLGFPTTVLNDGKLLNNLMIAEYDTKKTTLINSKLLIPSKKGYDDLDVNPIIRRNIGQTWETRAERIASDLQRFATYITTPKGIIFIAKQQGLQLMNPNVQSFGPRATQIYNPLSIPAAISGWSLGYHPNRHGFFGLELNYEDITKLKNLDALNMPLMPAPLTGNRILQMLKYKNNGMLDPGYINLPYSGPMGPNSIFGLGATWTTVAMNKTFTRLENVLLDKEKNKIENISALVSLNDARTYTD